MCFFLFVFLIVKTCAETDAKSLDNIKHLGELSVKIQGTHLLDFIHVGSSVSLAHLTLLFVVLLYFFL